MKVLVDTNVALDILLNRQSGYTNAAFIFTIPAVTPEQFIRIVTVLED
jgi:predicted nucleic acid-binding protein